MAKNPQKKQLPPTKKHQARLDREKQQTRWIIIGTVAVVVLVIGLILAGIANEKLIKPNRTAATVESEKITVSEFQEFTRFIRSTMVDNAIQTYQFMQLFEGNPETLSSFVSQLQQIEQQLNQNTAGPEAIDQLIKNSVIQREAEKRGISVTDDEVREEFKKLLGYFPDGTPVPSPTPAPLPTSTYTLLQLTAIAPTLTPTRDATFEQETATPTQEIETTPLPPTTTLEPTLSPTPYTEEGYKTEYTNIITKYKDYGVSENLLFYVVRMQILTEELRQAFLEENEIPNTQEQVWARHILVPEEATVNEVKTRLVEGEDWCSLAAEYSIDESNKMNCGDLGWFAKGAMVEPFETAAFSTPIGEISSPVQTSFGWHLIGVLGHEERPISDAEYQSLQNQAFNGWLDNLVSEASVEIADFLNDIAPSEPGFPVEIQQFILQNQQNPAP